MEFRFKNLDLYADLAKSSLPDVQNQFCLSKQLSYDAAKLSCENVFIRSVTLIPCGDSLNTLDVSRCNPYNHQSVKTYFLVGISDHVRQRPDLLSLKLYQG